MVKAVVVRRRLRETSSSLADRLQVTRALVRGTRHGGRAAELSGLTAAVDAADAVALAGAGAVLWRRRARGGKGGTAANQWRTYCRAKGLAAWPVRLAPLEGWVVWRLATVSARTGETDKATGTDGAVAGLRRYARAYTPSRWALTDADEATLKERCRVVVSHVPSTLESCRILSHEEMLRVARAIRAVPPSPVSRQAMALLTCCIGFQGYYAALCRLQLRDTFFEPAGVVARMVRGKLDHGARIVERLIFASHLGGELHLLCATSALQDMLETDVEGYCSAWHQEGHPMSERRLLGRVVDGKLTDSPLRPEDLLHSLRPFVRAAGLPDDALTSSHFGRGTGASMYEFQLRVKEEDVKMFAGRGGMGSCYRTNYRDVRGNPRLFGRVCGESVVEGGSAFTPGTPALCCL